MSHHSKSTEKLMALLTACASAIAALCFFLPMITISIFGTWNLTGFDLIDEFGDEAYILIIALAGSGLGLVFALIALSNRKLLIGNVVLSVIAMAGIFIAFGTEDMFSKAGVGFYLFVVMHLAAITLSIIGLTRPVASPAPTVMK